eukprot:5961501-Alexandrium_andersonii.AAC.1
MRNGKRVLGGDCLGHPGAPGKSTAAANPFRAPGSGAAQARGHVLQDPAVRARAARWPLGPGHFTHERNRALAALRPQPGLVATHGEATRVGWRGCEGAGSRKGGGRLA